MRALAHDNHVGGHQPLHANVAVEFLHPACASVRDLDHYAHSIGAQWVVLLRDPARDHEGGGAASVHGGGGGSSSGGGGGGGGGSSQHG